MSWLKLHLPLPTSRPSSRPNSRPSTPEPGVDHPTPENKTLFQTFEWHTPSQPPAPDHTHAPSSHYARLSRLLPSLAQLGVTRVWLPPGCKANNPQSNGYDCYDLWDLGEFEQKSARSTKWGSREELRDLMDVAKRESVQCIWDAVLNHKTAGDALEETWAVEVNKEDRRIEICAPKKITAWLQYDFPGRAKAEMKYSPFKWRAEHFNGTDWDDRAKRNAIYKLVDDPATYPKSFMSQAPLLDSGLNRIARLSGKGNKAAVPDRRPGKGWAKDVDDLHGNFDYLMFTNIDYSHTDVKADALSWAEWMIEEVGVDGFRLDAVQHISFAFVRQWIRRVQDVSSKKQSASAFVVGEIWTGELNRITRWLDSVPSGTYAYDSPLLYSFSRISEDVRAGSKHADLRTIVRNTLVQLRPKQAVTLVTNHDTQPGQPAYTPINADLKSLFYAFILLRQDGLPCVFWGDLFGTKGPQAEPAACLVQDGKGGKRSLLPNLMLARKLFAYGEQRNYFDAMSCIGWTRAGTHDRPGCAVVLSIGPVAGSTVRKMLIGAPDEKWVDVLTTPDQRVEITIDGRGFGAFPCRGQSVSVFVRKDAQGVERFPVEFSLDMDQI